MVRGHIGGREEETEEEEKKNRNILGCWKLNKRGRVRRGLQSESASDTDRLSGPVASCRFGLVSTMRKERTIGEWLSDV